MDLKEAVRRSDSWKRDYPDIFKENDGVGENFENGRHKYHTEKEWGTERVPKRRVTIELSSFVGISTEAVHYYGKLKVMGVRMVDNDDPRSTLFVSSNERPLISSVHELTLKRPVTQKEIDNNICRWDCYQEGDLTEAFESIDDIVNLAKEIFALRFEGDWELWLKDLNGEQRKIQ